MKERPIIFSGPMVRAILEGRKTQARRLYTSQGKWHAYTHLWVKETFQWRWKHIDTPALSANSPEGWDLVYVATEGIQELWNDEKGLHTACAPSIHMPHWASRIKLEIRSVTSEYLQDIDEAGAKAEGFPSVEEFKALWNKTFAKRPLAHWDNNPPVYVIEFRRLT